jgi:putative DNA primase/helicase
MSGVDVKMEANMNSLDFKRRVEEVKHQARGNWGGILRRLLVDHKVINRKNQPCPRCQDGRDRFQYTDKFGNGDSYCRYCGHMDGFELLHACNGWSFAETLKAVEELVGTVADWPRVSKSEPSLERMRKLAKRIWEEAKPIEAGDEVACYLARRGLGMEQYPRSLRTHPALGFYVREESGRKSKLACRYAAMLAAVQAADGHAVTVHRTYLESGDKAKVREPKKLLNAGIHGAAIRLFEATDELALAEGIETALAVHLRTGKPVWATVSAVNMEKVWIPDTVKSICIYADNLRHEVA